MKREELNLQPLDASGFGPFDTETYLWPNRTVIMNRNVVLSIGFKTDLKVKTENHFSYLDRSLFEFADDIIGEEIKNFWPQTANLKTCAGKSVNMGKIL